MEEINRTHNTISATQTCLSGIKQGFDILELSMGAVRNYNWFWKI